MSIAEMKWEITSSLNNLSEKALAEIMVHIKQLESVSEAGESRADTHFKKIMEEDVNLLKRLAQ